MSTHILLYYYYVFLSLHCMLKWHIDKLKANLTEATSQSPSQLFQVFNITLAYSITETFIDSKREVLYNQTNTKVFWVQYLLLSFCYCFPLYDGVGVYVLSHTIAYSSLEECIAKLHNHNFVFLSVLHKCLEDLTYCNHMQLLYGSPSLAKSCQEAEIRCHRHLW